MSRMRRQWNVLLFVGLMTVEGAGLVRAGEVAKVARPPQAGAPSVSRGMTERPAPTLPAAAHALLTPLWVPSAPATPGMILALDPLTGERVSPTAGQVQEIQLGMAALWDRSGEFIEVTLPNGSRGAYVGRRFAKALMAYRSASGKVAWGCGPAGTVQVPVEE